MTVPGVGRWVVVDGTIEFTPADGYRGTARIGYEVTDTAGITESSTATVVVSAPATPSKDGLAFTGIEVAHLGTLGLALLGVGLVLLVAANRRRQRS